MRVSRLDFPGEDDHDSDDSCCVELGRPHRREAHRDSGHTCCTKQDIHCKACTTRFVCDELREENRKKAEEKKLKEDAERNNNGGDTDTNPKVAQESTRITTAMFARPLLASVLTRDPVVLGGIDPSDTWVPPAPRRPLRQWNFKPSLAAESIPGPDSFGSVHPEAAGRADAALRLPPPTFPGPSTFPSPLPENPKSSATRRGAFGEADATTPLPRWAFRGPSSFPKTFSDDFNPADHEELDKGEVASRLPRSTFAGPQTVPNPFLEKKDELSPAVDLLENIAISDGGIQMKFPRKLRRDYPPAVTLDLPARKKTKKEKKREEEERKRRDPRVRDFTDPIPIPRKASNKRRREISPISDDFTTSEGVDIVYLDELEDEVHDEYEGEPEFFGPMDDI